MFRDCIYTSAFEPHDRPKVMGQTAGDWNLQNGSRKVYIFVSKVINTNHQANKKKKTNKQTDETFWYAKNKDLSKHGERFVG